MNNYTFYELNFYFYDMKMWAQILFNKYFLSFAFMLVWVLFFDETDFFIQQSRLKDLDNLKTKAAYYKKEIEIAQQELSDIQHNPEALEKFAREKYFLKKDNEDIYIIEYPQP
ncbi:MAG: septum formation initiator family protein [Chitinophagaceae bacterium]|nr:septum formation initiator family protein [Chitinophagaceae bacterium]